LSLLALILEKSPPFLERQSLGAARRVDAYNAQPGASLRPGDPSLSTQHKRQLLATSLEEGRHEFEESR
jgi:hypothetical protein